MTARLDAWMPRPDVSSAHATTVAAPTDRVYAALLDTDFGRQPLVALLMALRSIPAFVLAPRASWRRLRSARPRRTGRLRSVLGSDFALLEEAPSEELVIGLTGRFWTPSGGLVASDPMTFREAPPAGMARAAWNFHLEPLGQGQTRLSTETRVRCADAATARRFRAYWRLVAPGSGLIRWAILRQVRRRAERPTVHGQAPPHAD
jgi:hypothetical protein